MTECKHKFAEQEKEDNGYWFRCVRCGIKIFGEIKRERNE